MRHIIIYTVDQPLRSILCVYIYRRHTAVTHTEILCRRRARIKVLFTLNKVYSDTQPISKLSVRNSGFLRRIIHTNGNALTNFLCAFGKYSALSSLSFQVFGAGGRHCFSVSPSSFCSSSSSPSTTPIRFTVCILYIHT